MTRIRVVVTAEDIARGIRENEWSCPIAHALHRGDYVAAEVGEFSWKPEPQSPRYPLSEAAQQFVRTFDRGFAVQPATFYLEGPDPS